MESSAVLANIGIILAKDLLNDDKNPERHTSQLFSFYDFDESSNEAETFFLQQKLGSSTKHAKKRLSKKHVDVNLLTVFKTMDFQRNLHMEKKTFMHIFNKLSSFTSKNTLYSGITSFSLAIWKLATDEHFEQISKRFGLPLFEAQNTIREFWRLISQNSKSFIDFPFRTEQMQPHMLAFQTISTELSLPNLCGVIAAKKLNIFLESNDEEVQIIWQIIVDANEMIMDVFVDFASDYSFESTPIFRMLEIKGFKPPLGYLIGDNNFPLRQYLMCPFKMPETDHECRFNTMLEPAFLLTHKVFDKIAKRFNALYALESRDIYEVRRIISSICVLHNICAAFGDDYVNKEEQNKNWSTSGRLDFDLKLDIPMEAALMRRNNLLKELTKIN